MQAPPPTLPAISPRPPRTAADLVWLAFLAWSAIGCVVMPLDIGEREVTRWLGDGLVRRTILAVLPVSDAVWIALAAILVYLHTSAAEGLGTARRWALLILGGSGVAEWIGARTGFPFGPYRYTEHFGWRIGGTLPVAIPLAWLVILLCGRVFVLRLRPGLGRLGLALGTAAVAVLTDLNLEFVAWKIRGYWVWYPGATGPVPSWPPPQNFVAWFLVSFGLLLVLPPSYGLRPRQPAPFRPVATLGLMNGLFLLTHAAHSWRLSGS